MSEVNEMMKRYEFSEMRKKLNEAHLEIVKRRQYRGARETDVVAWLADYVEQNFISKNNFKELQKENEKLLKFKEEMWKLGQAMPPNAISMLIQRELGKL